MGRFGNVMLTGGETNLALDAQVGEVVRFYFTNTANTRLFNVALPGARMKLVGSDSGRYEHETFVDEVLLAPSERAIVDVRFDSAGTIPLEHRTPDRTYILGTVDVTDAGATSSTAARVRRAAHERRSSRAGGRASTRTSRADPTRRSRSSRRCRSSTATRTPPRTAYTCPMHPDVIATEPGTCPQCGMKLVPRADHVRLPDAPRRHVRHRRQRARSAGCGSFPRAARPAPTTPHEPRTRARARPRHGRRARVGRPHAGDQRGVERAQHDLEARRRRHRQGELGDRLGVPCRRPRQDPAASTTWTKTTRCTTRSTSTAPGRFLILARDDVVEPNLAWKDTVLVRSGETVDILLDVTNPGLWMAHCHIAEHNQSGMMFSFPVREA